MGYFDGYLDDAQKLKERQQKVNSIRQNVVDPSTASPMPLPTTQQPTNTNGAFQNSSHQSIGNAVGGFFGGVGNFLKDTTKNTLTTVGNIEAAPFKYGWNVLKTFGDMTNTVDREIQAHLGSVLARPIATIEALTTTPFQKDEGLVSHFVNSINRTENALKASREQLKQKGLGDVLVHSLLQNENDSFGTSIASIMVDLIGSPTNTITFLKPFQAARETIRAAGLASEGAQVTGTAAKGIRALTTGENLLTPDIQKSTGVIASIANRYAPQLMKARDVATSAKTYAGGKSIDIVQGLMNPRTVTALNQSEHGAKTLQEFSQFIAADAAKEGFALTPTLVKEHALQTLGPIFDATHPAEQARLLTQYMDLQKELQTLNKGWTLKRIDKFLPDVTPEGLKQGSTKLFDIINEGKLNKIEAAKLSAGSSISWDYLEKAVKAGYVPVQRPTRAFVEAGVDTGKQFNEVYANSFISKALQHVAPVFAGQSNEEIRILMQQNLINKIADLTTTTGEKVDPQTLSSIFREMDARLFASKTAKETLATTGNLTQRVTNKYIAPNFENYDQLGTKFFKSLEQKYGVKGLAEVVRGSQDVGFAKGGLRNVSQKLRGAPYIGRVADNYISARNTLRFGGSPLFHAQNIIENTVHKLFYGAQQFDPNVEKIFGDASLRGMDLFAGDLARTGRTYDQNTIKLLAGHKFNFEMNRLMQGTAYEKDGLQGLLSRIGNLMPAAEENITQAAGKGIDLSIKNALINQDKALAPALRDMEEAYRLSHKWASTKLYGKTRSGLERTLNSIFFPTSYVRRTASNITELYGTNPAVPVLAKGVAETYDKIVKAVFKENDIKPEDWPRKSKTFQILQQILPMGTFGTDLGAGLQYAPLKEYLYEIAKKNGATDQQLFNAGLYRSPQKTPIQRLTGDFFKILNQINTATGAAQEIQNSINKLGK